MNKDTLLMETWAKLTDHEKQSVKDRFNKFLRKDGEHIIWTSNSSNFSVDGQRFVVPRVAWYIFGGRPLTPNCYIQQICEHNKCFCKDHLVALTKASPTSKGQMGATPDDWIYAWFLITSHSRVQPRSPDEHEGVLGNHLIWTGKIRGGYGIDRVA